MAKEDRFVVIYMLLGQLKDVGKIKFQKLIYFLQYVFRLPFGYDYRMHHYGPYSDELNDDLTLMQMSNYIDIKADSSGYGYHIKPGGEDLTSRNAVLTKYSKQIQACLEKFKDFTPSQLEILGTLHFVRYVAGVEGKNNVIEKTAMLKPAYSKQSIEKMYGTLDALVNSS
jgi:uncharacterized protein